MKKITLVKCIVFLAAFLLFQIELIVAKILLPQFGGGYSVWGAAVVFFQATLLLGYLYSHIVIRRLGIARYRYIHIGLMALTLLFFPGRSLPAMGLSPHLPMVINIFWQLSYMIGPVFFFLTTISIILQSWLVSSELDERSNPYTLYGVSNLGSFAALLSYPFLFEPTIGLDTQLHIWRIAYLVLAALSIALLGIVKIKPPVKESEDLPTALNVKDGLKWFLFGAAGVIMFLSITNIITYEIIPMPLLWVLPLAIYLISFVLNFKKVPWCPGWIRKKIHIILAVSVVIYFLMEAKCVEFAIMLITYLAVLFAICMFCQSELYRSRPQNGRNLTLFYLIISFGGFIGGLLVSWVIPLLSSSTIEYLIGLLAVALALTLDQKRPMFYSRYIPPIVWLLVMLVIWPLVFWGYNVFGIIIMIWVFCWAYSKLQEKPFMIMISLLLILCMALSPLMNILWSKQNIIYKHRNYYGIYKIDQAQEKRNLTNGNTLHGGQYIIKDREMIPLMYYHYSTPMGLLLTSQLFKFNHIGMIGLGTGTLAAYGRPDNTIDFYELDPDVYNIATKYFTYLKNSAAKINFTFGDARITLKKAPGNYYDILLIDAFSGDYIPTHLLTTDAISEYRKHLTEKGIILFHVSNRYLELQHVLFADADALSAYACSASNQSSLDASASEWVALTWDRRVFETLIARLKWSPAPKKLSRWSRPWTDRYTNVLGALRIRYLVNQIKTFQPFYWSFNISPNRMKNMYYYAAQGSRSLLESNFNQSISYYQKALELNPNDPIILRSLGNAYYMSGQYQQAITSYQKAIEIDPRNADILRNLGRAYAQQGLNNDAITYYKKAIDVNPNDPEAFLGMGSVYNNLGKSEEAAVCYRRAAELNPNAFNIVMANKIQQDILRYQKVLGVNPKDTGTLLNIGNAYYFLQQYKQAAEAYQKLIEINPNNSDAMEKLGDVYDKLLDPSQAEAYYLKVIAVNPPGSVGVLRKLGKASAKQKDYSKSLDYLNKALAIDPAEPFIYLEMALAYMMLKENGKFTENMLKARKIFQDKNDVKSVKMVDVLLDRFKAQR
jgi:tetratricopeptide (TPR) repeat protein